MRLSLPVSQLVLMVFFANSASAATVQYNLIFSGGSPSPTSGSFAYDTTAGSFTSFNVIWNGINFNLLPSANNPVTQNACPVLNAAQFFAILTGGGQCGGVNVSRIWSVYPPNPPGNVFNTSLSLQLFTPADAGFLIGGEDPDSSFIATPTSGTFTVAGLDFYPVTPCRVADTRTGAGFTGAFGPPSMAAATSRTFSIPSSSCGIPATAAAYSLNFTVVPPAGLGFLTTWPTGQSMPNVSTLNSPTGAVVANAAIVPAGLNGAIDVYVSNATDVVFDINGYFAPPLPSGLQFYPVTPCRVADTRTGTGFTGAFGPPAMTVGSQRIFPIPGTCGIPATAAAYSLNFTAVPHGPLGYLSAFPNGQSIPNVSTLNSPNGTTVANAAIVPAGLNGAVAVYASNATDVLFDVNGYFALPSVSGLQFYPVTPCRVADTRTGSGFIGVFGAPSLAAATQRIFPMPLSTCGIPASVGAYSLNFTVVPPASLGYLSTWPTGQSMPNVSTLNSSTGTTVANAAIVPAGQSGAISVYASNPTDLLFDINGYFQ